MSRRFRLLRLVLAATVLAVVAFLALRASPYLQYIPWMPRRIGIWADQHGIVRNVAAFFVLSLAVYFLVGRRAWHIGALCVFGIAIEVAQLWIRGRVFDWWDIAASVAGVLLAWPVAWIIRPRPAAQRC